MTYILSNSNQGHDNQVVAKEIGYYVKIRRPVTWKLLIRGNRKI